MSIILFFSKIIKKIFKKHHQIKSKGNGVVSTKLILTNMKDEHNQPIFKEGKSEIIYITEPCVTRAEKELNRFNKFLEKTQELPPRNHKFWFEEFS